MRADRLLAAVLLALGAAPAGADLGTLFHTAEERARLDALRRGESPARQSAAPSHPLTPEVTGFVKRSDGRNTIWIDGRAISTNNPKANPLLDPRRVRDIYPDLPPDAIKITPSKKDAGR